MVCREMRKASRGMNRRGCRGARSGILIADRSESRWIPLDAGVRRVSNTCSGEPGGVSQGAINAHLGNPGQEFTVPRSLTRTVKCERECNPVR